MKLFLHRIEFTPTHIRGLLYADGVKVCHTLELPWRNNERNVSCIPAGRYKVVRRTSARFGNHLHIVDVPGRELILIHTGNTVDDIRGCILPGMEAGALNGKQAVLKSKIAMIQLLEIARNKKLEITIE